MITLLEEMKRDIDHGSPQSTTGVSLRVTEGYEQNLLELYFRPFREVRHSVEISGQK